MLPDVVEHDIHIQAYQPPASSKEARPVLFREPRGHPHGRHMPSMTSSGALQASSTVPVMDGFRQAQHPEQAPDQP